MERRVDPDDGQARTLAEVMQRYAGVYSKPEIEAYFRDECVPVSSPAKSGCVQGLEGWLRERDLEQFSEYVERWCKENGAATIQEVEENFEEIKALILASEIEPGERVRVKVLHGKWKGQYVAKVLETNAKGVRLQHEEDGYEETLPWSSLGGNKYSMDPVSDDEEEGPEQDLSKLLRRGRLRVDADAGAGLELRWVKLGYRVDSLEPHPGQPDLRAGDAIVGAGGRLLAGLDEDGVEQRFGEAFTDGAVFVAGPLEELMRAPLEEVCRRTQQLLLAA